MKKISQISDDLFTVRSYVMDDGQDAIEGWFDKQSEEVQAAFVVALRTLRATRRKWWRSALCAELGGGGQSKCVGLMRIKIVHKPKKGSDEQERILAYEGPNNRQITMLMGFSKSMDPDYSLSCPEAQERKLKVESDSNRSRDCRL